MIGTDLIDQDDVMMKRNGKKKKCEDSPLNEESADANIDIAALHHSPSTTQDSKDCTPDDDEIFECFGMNKSILAKDVTKSPLSLVFSSKTNKWHLKQRQGRKIQ